MVQTDRKAETTRRTDREQDRSTRQQKRESPVTAAQALEAILSGGSWEQIPEDGLLALSHTMGNAALAEAAALRSSGPERETVPLPHGGIAAGPMEGAFGVPLTAEAPAFGSMSPIGTLAPAEA